MSNPEAPEQDIVLIVDDVPSNIAVLSDALDAAGYMVIVALDGPSALERLQFVTPDIILLDAVMPGLDGFEVCRRLKRLESARHIPVIFMTGLTETENVVRGFAAGGVDYVTKPIRTDEVLVRIETHLANARMMRQAHDAIDITGRAVLVLSREGKPVWYTPLARARLEAHFPRSSEPGFDVPEALREWAAAQTGEQSATPFSAANQATRLTVHYLGVVSGGEILLLLDEREVEQTPEALVQTFNLTSREAEVLLWAAKGKTNRDIGDILGISPRTVNKHLDHVYAKLGVETRTAAAALAMGGRIAPPA